MDEDFFSKRRFHCKDSPHDLINYGHVKIISIIQCSKVYDYGIYEQLQTRLDPDSSLTNTLHKILCVYLPMNPTFNDTYCARNTRYLLQKRPKKLRCA